MTQIRGVVERITYRNEENLYTVARFKEDGKQSLTTIVGSFPSISVGETLLLTGSWVTHKEYGVQFQVDRAELSAPTTVEGIEKYLGSGLIKGIGPVTAKRLVAHFGLDTLNVIDQQPQRLLEVEGVGEKKAAIIAQAFQAQKDVHQIMAFLQSCGVTSGIAVRIYKEYGKDSIAIVKKEPYRLAAEVFGIGFKTADKIARTLGIEQDSPPRLAAGLQHTLSEAAGEGHVFMPRGQLIQRAGEILDVKPEVIEPVLDGEIAAGRLIEEPWDTGQMGDGPEQKPQGAVYLRPFHIAETMAARRLTRLLLHPSTQQLPLGGSPKQLIRQCEQDAGLVLSPGQRQAVEAALSGQVAVITGGPGTGKTTIVKVILRVLARQGKKYLLAAPTGRAAKRLSEATGEQAKTIHRLLEFGYSAEEGMRFQRDEERPLDADAVIIDEASMLDIVLFNHLLKALQPGTKLILVGDVDQLPPVGAGQVLRDLIESQAVVVARLTEVYRQAASSLIVTNAHRINRGQWPRWNQPDGDFFWIDAPDTEAAAQTVRDLVTDRLPGYYGLDPREDIQVLTPTRRTVIGTQWLNQVLQEAINPLKPGQAQLQYRGSSYRLGDKVMQLKNNYEKGVFNGDVGRVVDLSDEDRELVVAFPDGEGERTVVYDQAELDELTLSYAVSVHKSQGSEYPAVVMPITFVAPNLRTRNLLYTAVTRAKRLVVLVGSRKALRSFIANKDESNRYSGLAARLQKTLRNTGLQK